MSQSHGTHAPVAALRAALPYLRLFQGQTFVVKVGGEIYDRQQRLESLLEQLCVLHRTGIRVVLVHGGGAQTTRLARQLGLEPRFADGRRITCEKTLEVATMTLNGTLKTRTVAALRGLGVDAVGVSGVDAGLLTARRRPVVTAGDERIDFGEVGDVVEVRPDVIEQLAAAGILPVVSPLSADAEGRVLNVNADTVAAALASALGAAKLIIASSVPGILEDESDPATLISYVDLAGVDALVASGVIHGGMMPKVAAVRAALEGGVPRVHVISYRMEDALLTEVFTNEGSGTMVVANTSEVEG